MFSKAIYLLFHLIRLDDFFYSLSLKLKVRIEFKIPFKFTLSFLDFFRLRDNRSSSESLLLSSESSESSSVESSESWRLRDFFFFDLLKEKEIKITEMRNEETSNGK